MPECKEGRTLYFTHHLASRTFVNVGQIPQVKEVGEQDSDAPVKEKEAIPSSPVSLRQYSAKIVRRDDARWDSDFDLHSLKSTLALASTFSALAGSVEKEVFVL